MTSATLNRRSFRRAAFDRPLAHVAHCAAAIALFYTLASSTFADDATSTPDLRHDVLPLLRSRCVKCHGPMKHESGLDLSTSRSIARGGESGAAIATDKPDDSLLWQRVEADEMPPEAPLSNQEKALLRSWLGAGRRACPTPKKPRGPAPIIGRLCGPSVRGHLRWHTESKLATTSIALCLRNWSAAD